MHELRQQKRQQQVGEVAWYWPGVSARMMTETQTAKRRTAAGSAVAACFYRCRHCAYLLWVALLHTCTSQLEPPMEAATGPAAMTQWPI